MFQQRSWPVLFLSCGLTLSGCGGGEQAPQGGEVGAAASEVVREREEEGSPIQRPREGTEEDWRIIREKATWAWELGIDTLSMGESMASLGLSFLGTRYVPGTLEVPGPEGLVVNVQELDCVTFLENVLALAHFIRLADPHILSSDLETRTLYRRILTGIRYRGGRIDGYPSRLHYFSDWILDNEEKGLVRELTEALGGTEDPRAVDFMSAHPDAYPQLSDPSTLEAIRQRETFLSDHVRYRIPSDQISGRASGIRDGDIIAATSSVDGLDVAHTGLALWRDGALHLLHAPLVGESVEISVLPLGDRIGRIESQDGIRVVRTLDPETRQNGGGEDRRPSLASAADHLKGQWGRISRIVTWG